MKKDKCKAILMERIKEAALIYLTALKDKHSKSGDLKLEKYLTSTNLNVEEKQTLFKFRNRIYDCKVNHRRSMNPIYIVLFVMLWIPKNISVLSSGQRHKSRRQQLSAFIWNT